MRFYLNTTPVNGVAFIHSICTFTCAISFVLLIFYALCLPTLYVVLAQNIGYRRRSTFFGSRLAENMLHHCDVILSLVYLT